MLVNYLLYCLQGATDFVCYKYGNDMRVDAYFNHPEVGTFTASPLTNRNFGISNDSVVIENNVMTCEFLLLAEYVYQVFEKIH